jgi:thioredoxin 1
MNRRDFIALTATITLVPALPAMAGIAGAAEYENGLVAKLLAKGETVFVDFSATWCSTCAAQTRVIDALNAKNPKYEQAITFVNVDWDSFGGGELSNSLNIPRRSTLVVLKGDQELGRIVAGTSKRKIRELMDVALGAATA